MSNFNTKRIIELLKERKKIKCQLLAIRLAYLNKLTGFGNREFRILGKSYDEAYDVFLSLLEPECREKLSSLDSTISSIEDNIEGTTGWYRTYYGMTLRCNFQNTHDREFQTCDKLTILRDKEGYYVSTREPHTRYLAFLRKKEIEFYERFEEELKILHDALTEKEAIMSESFTIKDEKDQELCERLCDYLGFSPEKLSRQFIKR